jgi:hypothetical protein
MAAVYALPGEDLVRKGLADLSEGRDTVEACLVCVGAPRLGPLGFGPGPRVIPMAEHRMYELLALEDQDSAHSRYNALIRRLVSFERAAECVKP